MELTKAYLEKGWKVIAAIRDPNSMPKLEGDVVTVKLDAGEKEDAKNVGTCNYFLSSKSHVKYVWQCMSERGLEYLQ